MNNRAFTLIGSLLVLGAGSAAAQVQPPSMPQTLSLDDALELAERYNPTYRQTANDRAPAAWAVRNAYSSFLPTFSVSSSATYRGAGTQRFLTTEFTQPSATIGSSYSLTLNWNFNGNTLLQPGVTKAALSASDASVDAMRLNVRSTIVQQYVGILEGKAQVALQERQVARNLENLRLAQARFDVGQATMIDVRQAEVAKGQSDVALLQAHQNVTVETLRLYQQMGVPAPEDLSTVTLSDTFPVVAPNWSLEDLLIEADANNPNVNAMRARETSAEWSERAVKSRWLPSISIFAGWSGFTQQFTNGDFLVPQAQGQLASNLTACNIQNTIHQDINSRGANLPVLACDQFFTFTPAIEAAILDGQRAFPFNFNNNPFVAQLTVSLPIFDQFDRNLRISQASAAAEDAQEFRRALELQTRTDVSQQYYALSTAYESIAIQDNNRTAAQDAMRLARARYRVGSGTFFELLDAQLANEQAEADYITASFNYHRSLVSLEAAVGRTLR